MEEVRRIADYVAFLVNGDFLGLYEKDVLLEGWKILWVDRTPGDVVRIPGLVSVEEGSLTRLVTSSPEETLGALGDRDIRVVRTGALDLEEILSHLLREKGGAG